MSFINWGGESPEQRAIRERLEQEALFEQAVRLKMQSQGGVGAAAGSGGPNFPSNQLYGVGFDGLIYRLDSTEENWVYNYENFPVFTCIALNTDDGFLYAVGQLYSEVYFIRIDRVTREFEFINNNISDFSSKGASSLYYEGNGQFIYLDNSDKNAITSVIRVTLVSNDTAIASEVVEVDANEAGFLLRNLFLYDGEVWAVALASPNFYIGPFDLNTGTFTYSNLLLPSPSQPNVATIDGVFSTIIHNGIVHMAAVWAGPEESSLGLFKVDTEYGGALAPYYVTLVKDLFIESAEGMPIYSLTSF